MEEYPENGSALHLGFVLPWLHSRRTIRECLDGGVRKMQESKMDKSSVQLSASRCAAILEAPRSCFPLSLPRVLHALASYFGTVACRPQVYPMSLHGSAESERSSVVESVSVAKMFLATVRAREGRSKLKLKRGRAHVVAVQGQERARGKVGWKSKWRVERTGDSQSRETRAGPHTYPQRR
ncbi:hypothetical protein BV20DRAFT_62897 [Pilatotrama ljubarskyi]|nr:hypothetical protein BV20DRAFT_62897 [Pilatotrama ljubarskyi]